MTASYSPIYTSVAAVQSKTSLSATEIDLTDDNIVRATIEDAEVELELLTGRKFTSSTAITEYINVNREDILGNKQTKIQTSQWPILSVTTFNILDLDNATEDALDTLTAAQIAAGTFYTADYWLDVSRDAVSNSVVANGHIALKVNSMSKQMQKVKIAYTYGYASVPVSIRDLATCLAGIRCWIRFMGGQYNRLNSYSIPQQTVNKGNFYERAQQNIAALQTEADRLLDRIGRKPRIYMYSTGSDR
jgi:hypothetical protein